MSETEKDSVEEEEKTVTVHLLVKRADGSAMSIGNSYECSLDEAIFLIENKDAKSGTHPIGVVPPEWLEPEQKSQDDEPVDADRLDAE